MSKVFTFFMVLVLLYISGCGADEDEVEVIEDIPVNFLSAVPPSGSVIGATATITITFDGIPSEVSINRGNFEVIENRIVVAPFYTVGEVELRVTWADGTQKLVYTLTAPCAGEDVGCE